MRKLIVNEFVSMDGVAQAPGGQEEDPSGGFAHGGWHMRYTQDERARAWVMEYIADMGALVLGRRTYEIFAGYWPNASEEEAFIAEPLNRVPKHVASTTLTEPLAWSNSSLLRPDVATALRALKQKDGRDLHVIGSAQLVRGLLADDLVDELRLMIDPLMLGGGKRIFPEDGELRRFRLAEHEFTNDGAVLATYSRQREEEAARDAA
ncbi:MAG TPA: dihydrofolate reductase family protein [Thermoleophilia bacterium]|nr:dihydrofolate reductase family protein [Thermoleophilia bacterium]